MLNIEWTVTGPFQENSYIVWKENTESCIIIDPGDDFENIIKMINKNSVKPIAIVNTHAHLDHIASVSDLKECYDIPFYLHYNESEVLKNYERDLKDIPDEVKKDIEIVPVKRIEEVLEYGLI